MRLGSPEVDGLDFTDLATPDGRMFWTSPAMYDPQMERPLYTTTQVGKFFFARSTQWVYKYLLTYPRLSHPDIGELEIFRTTGQRPARRWRLYDVEMWAHILAASGVIQGYELAGTVRILKLSATQWGYTL